MATPEQHIRQFWREYGQALAAAEALRIDALITGDGRMSEKQGFFFSVLDIHLNDGHKPDDALRLTVREYAAVYYPDVKKTPSVQEFERKGLIEEDTAE